MHLLPFPNQKRVRAFTISGKAAKVYASIIKVIVLLYIMYNIMLLLLLYIRQFIGEKIVKQNDYKT